MARPPMPIGTYNSINATEKAPGVWVAKTYFRDLDGVRRPVERRGSSKPKAIRNLQAHLAERAEGAQGGELKSSSRFREAAALWLAEVEPVRRGSTMDNYRQRLDSLVLPAFGELLLREITPGMLEGFMTRLHKRGLSVSTRRNVRTVLNGALGVATRHGALRANPVRDMRRIEGGPKRAVRALTVAERSDLLAKLDADKLAVKRDIPSLVRFMLGTGVRIGEALAVRWCDVDLEGVEMVVDGQTIWVYPVTINGNMSPVRGQGLVRHTGKTAASVRTVPMPAFLVTMLQVRREADAPPHEPVFRSDVMTHRWPTNVGKMLRHARDKAGYPWVTSHVFRKTAATILDEQGLSGRQIADQLGHSRPSITQDVYMHRGEMHPAAAAAFDEALRVRD